MLRPPPEIIQQWGTIARQHPAVVQWMSDWYRRELEQLPYVGSSTSLAQGRCQVLTEMNKLLQDAPDLAAESRKR